MQFAVSGETESFGSNNLMGQWLSAVGGYTVEQVGKYIIYSHMSVPESGGLCQITIPVE